MAKTSQHIPVMLREVLAALSPIDQGIYVDGTFGRGGYARALLTAAKTQVFGIDRDPDAIAAGQSMVKEFAPRLHLLQGLFGDVDHLLNAENVTAVDGVTLDLGVSSPQLDQAERGFSFQADGPLDMRMSRAGTSAADIVNTMAERELAEIIFTYGEERHSRHIAKKIVAARAVHPITRTRELAEIVRHVVPRSKDGIDPATRTFQALRIAVNDELGELRRGLFAAERLLKPKGRLAIVSFHSLEDRCVKDFLRQHSADAPRASRHAPANPPSPPPWRVLRRGKPQLPSAADVAANPRARSARLRVAERTDAPAYRENAA
jgi:16S rRNA (cytosine1402-N4)-methyltransferase